VRLDLVRSGGIAGLQQWSSLDTATLAPNEARELERLVAAADIDELERRSPIRSDGADRFEYELRIEQSGQERRITVAEDKVPLRLRSVFKRIEQQLPRQGPARGG